MTTEERAELAELTVHKEQWRRWAIENRAVLTEAQAALATARQEERRWAANEIRAFARDCDIDEREVRRLADRIERGPSPNNEWQDVE